MKKRVKLLTTIASLCLAVALMAFGVYAATNVNMTVNSTLSFTASEIMGTWELQVTPSASNATATNNAYEDKTVVAEAKNTDSGKPVTGTVQASDLAFSLKDGGYVDYIVTFTATGEVEANITVSASFAEEKAGYSILTTENEEWTNVTNGTTTSKVYTTTIRVKLDVSETGFNAAEASSVTLTIECAATPAV